MLINTIGQVILSVALVVLALRLVLAVLNYYHYVKTSSNALHKVKKFRILFLAKTERYVIQGYVGLSWKNTKEIIGLQCYSYEFIELDKAQDAVEFFLEEVRKSKRKNIVVEKYKV